MTRPFEFYETPAGVTEILLRQLRLEIKPGQCIFDPCVGQGAITEVVSRLAPGVNVLTNDLNPERPAGWHKDATKEESWRSFADFGPWPLHWIITNPPFSRAHEIIPHAVTYAAVGVAMLLPLRFMEPTNERADVLQAHRWHGEIILGSPRPSFTEDGRTDSVTTFWAVWLRGHAPIRRHYATAPETRWADLAEMRTIT